ncbi:hypothetical protein VS893_24735, partial [Shigella flexneri]|nr:hypothetical protein [Shigella flexneri]
LLAEVSQPKRDFSEEEIIARMTDPRWSTKWCAGLEDAAVEDLLAEVSQPKRDFSEEEIIARMTDPRWSTKWCA